MNVIDNPKTGASDLELLTTVHLFIYLFTFVAYKGPDDSSEESKDDDDDDDDVCSLPAIKPSLVACLAFSTRWTFKDGACREITYGGCGGTKNLFLTKDACDAKCNRKGVSFKRLLIC